MPTLKFIEEHDASGRIAEIYKDIKKSFKVPLVSSYFKVLASFPDFLESYWSQLKPNLSTRFFAVTSRHIGNLADAMVDPLFEFVDDYTWMKNRGMSRESMREIRYALELFHYVLPKLSLVASHLDLVVKNAELSPADNRESNVQEPDFSAKVQLVRPHSAPKEVEYIYLDIGDTTRIPHISSIYQVFGRWPEYLRHAWTDEVKPVILTQDFRREVSKLQAIITDFASQMPYPADAGMLMMSEDEKGEIVKITGMYTRVFPEMVVVSSALRNMIVDGERMSRAADEHVERTV